ncbi:MAG: hypothetical protein KY410_06830, partial [Proteobacteria bacterium]|nr:hypothetical protein [Pseudomonadota bacterium]
MVNGGKVSAFGWSLIIHAVVATGFLDMVVGSQAVATKKGLFAYRNGTSTNLTTTVRTADGTAHNLVALTENLNPGGVGFRTGEPMRVGTEVRLTLSLTTGTMN